MSSIKSYRELIVWSKSKELSIKIYRNTVAFPKHETFGLTTQMRRAAVSIPSNIAEGFARFHPKEFIRFLRIALGSLYELSTQIEIATELKYYDAKKIESINNDCLEIEKMINSLIKSISKRI